MKQNFDESRMLIDGDCGICQEAGKILARITQGRLRIEPWQSVTPLPPSVTAGQLNDAVAFVAKDGHVFWGAQAISEALGTSASCVVVLAGKALRTFPISVAGDIAYRAIARNRHRISSALGLVACTVPREI